MKTKELSAILTCISLISGMISAVPVSAADVTAGGDFEIPQGWASIASDDMSSYEAAAGIKNTNLGNWTVLNAGDGVDVVDISNEQDIDSGTGKALKLNADGDGATYTLGSLSAPFLVKMDFYDSAPQTTKGTTIMTKYSDGVAGDYFVLGYNMGGTHYGIRHGGNDWRKSTVARSKKWHEYAVYADGSGNLKYYLDGVDITGPDLALGTGSLQLIQFRAAWGSAQDVSDNVCYLTNLNIYQPEAAEPVSSPDRYPVRYGWAASTSDDMSSYATGKYDDNAALDKWKLSNGDGDGVEVVDVSSDPGTGTCHALKLDATNETATYTLDNTLTAPFVVKLDFYDPYENNKQSAALIDMTYYGGGYDRLIMGYNDNNAGKSYHVRFGGTWNNTSADMKVDRSAGWHEYAVYADENGNLSYYIDNTKLNISRTIGQLSLNSITLQVAGWGNCSYTGYYTNLNIYQPAVSCLSSGSLLLPEYAVHVVSDDISSYTAGTYKNRKIGDNWNAANNGDGVDVVDISTDPGVGAGKALKLNTGGDQASYTLDSTLEAPFIVKFNFYDPNPTEGNGATYQIDYSDGQYDFLTFCNSNQVSTKYSIRQGGARNESSVTRSAGWHELAVYADDSGVVSYYIDGSKLNVPDRLLSSAQALKGVSVRAAGWNHANQTGYIANLRIYKENMVSGDVATIDIPSDAKLVDTDRLEELDGINYTGGKFVWNGKWKLGLAGTYSLESDILRSEGKSLKLATGPNGAASYAVAAYNLDDWQQLEPPFIVTSKFYHSGSINSAMSYGVTYSNGGSDIIGTRYYNSPDIETASFQLRANASNPEVANTNYFTKTNVQYSKGWHEFAVAADADGNTSYYIDGTQMINKQGDRFGVKSGQPISFKIPEGVKLTGFEMRAGAQWNDTSWDADTASKAYTGYIRDIRFYSFEDIPTPEPLPEKHMRIEQNGTKYTAVADEWTADAPELLLAVYKGDMFVDVVRGELNGDSITAELDADKYKAFDYGKYTVKAFLWEGDNIKPLAESEEASFSIAYEDYCNVDPEKAFAEIKDEAKRELAAYGEAAAGYLSDVEEKDNAADVYAVLDNAVKDLGIKTVSVPYNGTVTLDAPVVLAQALSQEGKTAGDTAAVEINGNDIKAIGIGRAVVSAGGVVYLIKSEKAPMALVLISGQSNAAGDESDPSLTPSALGKYKGRYLVTNSMANRLPVSEVSWDNAVYSAEHGGAPAPDMAYGTWALKDWSAAAANQLGARLSDEWDMPIWVVNTAVGGQRMEAFDPENSSHPTYTSTVNYVNKIKGIIEADSHYYLDESKTGLFWLQGCSNGINTHVTSAEDYTGMFLRMYNGWKQSIGINYAGIWMVRSGIGDTNAPAGFYMSGPRISQFYMSNSDDERFRNIYLVLNTDVWRTDEGVNDYFILRHSDADEFKAYYGYERPSTVNEIKPDLHHRQKGYNELGDVAGDVISIILNGAVEEAETAALFDYYGYEVAESGFEIKADEEQLAVPVLTNLFYNASVGISVVSENENVAVFDNDTFMLKGVAAGQTSLKLVCNGKTLATYPVSVTE